MSKTDIFFLFLFVIPWIHGVQAQKSAITYIDTPGRLGDKLIVYAKAKWLSYTYNLPLLYVPLKQFDNFVMHQTEKHYHRSMRKNFTKTIELKRNKNFTIKPDKGILYICNYYSPVPIDWNNKAFLRILRENIFPILPIKKYTIPDNRISIAVHVRKGGGFDTPLFSDQGLQELDVSKCSDWKPTQQHKKKYCDCQHPFKFPPDKYYVDQIRKIYELCKNLPLHIHIFTDFKKPSAILEKYQNALQDLDITFSTRSDEGSYKNSILDALFGMTQFDCLIRSESNFSFWADMLQDYIIVIYPTKMSWRKCDSCYWLIVDEVNVKL